MSTASENLEATSGEAERPPMPSIGKWEARLVFFAVLALAAGPWMVPFWRVEIAKWYVAAAQQAKYDGDVARGLEHIESAMQWNRDSHLARIERIDLVSNTGRGSLALADANWLIQRDPQNASHLESRGAVLQSIGQAALAVRDYEASLQIAKDAQLDLGVIVVRQNNVAYAKAVAAVDLDTALEQIEDTIDATGGEAAAISSKDVLEFRELVSGRFKDEVVLSRYEALKQRARHRLRSLQRKAFRAEMRINKTSSADKQDRALLAYSIARAQDFRLFYFDVLVGLRSHLKDKEDASDDEIAGKLEAANEELKQLHLDGLPKSEAKSRTYANLVSISTYMDTRAWVRFQRGELDLARRDIQEAIRHRRWWRSHIAKRQVDAFQEKTHHDYEKKKDDRVLAVLYHHQAEIAKKLNLDAEAERAEAEIKLLGFDPEENLF